MSILFTAVSQNSIWYIVDNLAFVEGREKRAKGCREERKREKRRKEGKRVRREEGSKGGRKEFHRQVIFL